MGLGVLMFSGITGFFAAVLSGLVLGLNFIEAFGVYWATGVVLAVALFTVRGLYCAAARRIHP